MEDILSGFEENAGEDEPVEEGRMQKEHPNRIKKSYRIQGDTTKGGYYETNKKTTLIYRRIFNV